MTGKSQIGKPGTLWQQELSEGLSTSITPQTRPLTRIVMMPTGSGVHGNGLCGLTSLGKVGEPCTLPCRCRRTAIIPIKNESKAAKARHHALETVETLEEQCGGCPVLEKVQAFIGLNDLRWDTVKWSSPA